MKLNPVSVRWALGSLKRFGDTDLFPHPIELDVVCADVEAAVSLISEIDLSTHIPAAARRFIVPKADLSYRQATQLDPLESVLLTALRLPVGCSVTHPNG